MQLVYAGELGTPHSQAWLDFLGGLGDLRGIDVATLGQLDCTNVDLVVVDADYRHELPAGVTLEQLSAPTVLVGNFGVKLGESLHLKLGNNYGCMCLAEDAIVWDASHPVFEGLTAIDKPTPAHFGADSLRAILDVPDTVPTLRVLRDPIDTPGQATADFGFADSPDCEVIAGGFNEKTQQHFAIGRQARFLQWGFAGTPDDYTDEGRQLLTACLRYITGFRDDPVREFRTAPSRGILQLWLAMDGGFGVGLPPEMRAVITEELLSRVIDGDIPAQLRGDRSERLAWFAENRPYLRNNGNGWYVDTAARDLGLPIDDPSLGGEGSYFTEWGGYRWVSALEPPSPQPPATTEPLAVATAVLGAARYDDTVKAMLMVQVPAGYYAYPPGSTDGLPVQVTVDGVPVTDLVVHADGPYLRGTVTAAFTTTTAEAELRAALRVQLCDELSCLAPQTIELRACL